MARSDYIYRYISSVWDFMPQKERNRFSELWKGYEQVFSDIYQRFLELDQTLNVNTMPVYMSSRWNQYFFDADTELFESATFRSFQDISLGVNTTDLYLIRIAVNGGPPVEIDCRGIDPANTSIREIVFAINSALGFQFASTVLEDSLLYFKTAQTGPSAKIEILPATDPTRDGTEIILGITPQELPYVTPRLPFKYILPDKNIRKIPSLQNAIHADEKLTAYFISGPDFGIDTSRGVIAFKERPPENLWAKVTYINEEMPYYNFGYLIDYADNSISREDYLLNLQGLWFAFWQGPRPDFIRSALCLLFGLPTAVDDGLILNKSGDLLEVLHTDGNVRAYLLPSQLEWVVNDGEFVSRFQPLCSGIDVYDKVNFPGFVQTEIGRNAIKPFALPEATTGTGPDTDETKALKLLEEHTFLPQINVNAFIRPEINVGSIFNFLTNIKPLHKAYYFQVIVALFNEDIGFQEHFEFDIDIDITPNLDSNQTNDQTDDIREDYEDNINAPLDLDSDAVFFFEKGLLTFEDKFGPLPQYEVVFD